MNKTLTVIAVCLLISISSKAQIKFWDGKKPEVLRSINSFSNKGEDYNQFRDTAGNYISVKLSGGVTIQGDTLSLIKNLLKFSIDHMMRRTVMISDKGDTTRWTVYDTIRITTCKQPIDTIRFRPLTRE